MPSSPLLMIPGPVTVSPAVLAALAEPPRSHTSAEVAECVRRVAGGLRLVAGSREARVYSVAGSGTLAMEMALINHAAPGDRVVVCSHGYFGDRFAEIAGVLGLEVTHLRSPWGGVLEPAQVSRAVAEGEPPALVTVTHVDTSTGTLADVAAVAAVARDAGSLVVLDGVCATAGVPEEMDAWCVDVLLTGAQKALGVPPGLALLLASPAAAERRSGLGPVRAYYADLARWDPVVDDPTRYFSTHAVNLLRALEVSLDEIRAEGLTARFERHRRLAQRLRDGFARLGMRPVTDAAALAPTLSVLAVPDGVDPAALRAGMLRRGVVVAAGLGPFAGHTIRIGHMGGIGEAEVDATVRAAEAALAEDAVSPASARP